MSDTQHVEVTEPAEPCSHMANLVSALADGSLRGPARWYTRFHLLTCASCSGALRALTALRVRLRALAGAAAPAGGGLTPERQAAVDAALDIVDAGSP